MLLLRLESLLVPRHNCVERRDSAVEPENIFMAMEQSAVVIMQHLVVHPMREVRILVIVLVLCVDVRVWLQQGWLHFVVRVQQRWVVRVDAADEAAKVLAVVQESLVLIEQIIDIYPIAGLQPFMHHEMVVRPGEAPEQENGSPKP